MKPERLRILLLDADRERRSLLSSRIRASVHGPATITAVGEQRELRSLRNGPFDVGVLSLSDGADAVSDARTVRAEFPGLPIIVVDGVTRPLDILLDSGIHDHVPRRCVDCPTNQRLASSIRWTLERNSLLQHLKDVREESDRRALHDPLTALPNRKLFVDRLSHLIPRCTRTRGGFAVLFVDLDRFKHVNDTLGHDVGDQVLVEVAKRLSASVRASDTCARWGGDEFLVTLEDTLSRSDAVRVAHKIKENLAPPILAGEHVLRIGASIGISLFPRDSRDAQVLIRQADHAMYRAKAIGGDHVQCFRGGMDEPDQGQARFEDQPLDSAPSPATGGQPRWSPVSSTAG